ncbi:MAG: hypothetical protein HC866_25605 [Leptolyngbyaceae cyanobacterium RU_5_1]|nr:hypothetical protein [Leptolyngbyaceae cyanobacterium RU_5_1]
MIGILSSTFVVSNLAFQKPYNPDKVTQDMSLEPIAPLIVTTVYGDFQDIALGLSFALRLHKQELAEPAPRSNIQFTFLARRQNYEQVWQTFATLNQPLPFPLNLWVISPGLKRVGYRNQLSLKDTTGLQHPCQIDPNHYHRLGIPYQLYRCR